MIAASAGKVEAGGNERRIEADHDAGRLMRDSVPNLDCWIFMNPRQSDANDRLPSRRSGARFNDFEGSPVRLTSVVSKH
jgi:hypothetical protein